MTMSVTKIVRIERPAAESHAFIAAPETMPQWAIHHVKAIRKLDGFRWEMKTPRGKASLIPNYEERNGILDHEFIDAGEGVWHVTGRAAPAGPPSRFTALGRLLPRSRGSAPVFRAVRLSHQFDTGNRQVDRFRRACCGNRLDRRNG
jgi:hypothetical protein